jgi:hypothetical protein
MWVIKAGLAILRGKSWAGTKVRKMSLGQGLACSVQAATQSQPAVGRRIDYQLETGLVELIFLESLTYPQISGLTR